MCIKQEDKYREAATNYRHISIGQFTGATLFILLLLGIIKEWTTSHTMEQAILMCRISWGVIATFFVATWLWTRKSKEQVDCAAKIEKQSIGTDDENSNQYKEEKQRCPFLRKPKTFPKVNYILCIVAIVLAILCYRFTMSTNWPLKAKQNIAKNSAKSNVQETLTLPLVDSNQPE